ncbi:hypothetical protein DFJ74DRAFT_730865 [Hyaloraphidium curvatum]|nr:hypothetical protein DFJ74DRAFT_730865 [Hyaloraphidium curvatum]
MPARLSLALLALLALAAPAFAYTDPFICLVNIERASRGLAPVGFWAPLQGVARSQADGMRWMGRVTHDGSDGSTPVTRLTALAPLGLSLGAENVAGGMLTSREAMTAFMNSPHHRDAILNPAYNCFGSARNGAFWAQEFASLPGGSCPVPDCSVGYRRLALARRGMEMGEEMPEPAVVVVGEGAAEAYEGAGDERSLA